MIRGDDMDKNKILVTMGVSLGASLDRHIDDFRHEIQQFRKTLKENHDVNLPTIHTCDHTDMQFREWSISINGSILYTDVIAHDHENPEKEILSSLKRWIVDNIELFN